MSRLYQDRVREKRRCRAAKSWKRKRNTNYRGLSTEFNVKYPDEYITWIGVTYRDDHRYDNETMSEQTQSQSDHEDEYLEPCFTNMDNNTVSELQFKTSYGRTSQRFGKPGSGSEEFELEGKNGTKLVGLHGRSGDFLDAIGAHFVLVSSAFKQLEPLGGSGGVSWDDGVYNVVKKVSVGEDGDRVSYVEFEYGKGGQSITHSHGKKPQERKEFLLDYAHDEYIESGEGTYDEDGSVSSLTFITSMERDREESGKAGCTKFVLNAKGFNKLVGFRGRSSVDRINALGANFAVVLAPPVKKLEAQGGDFGDEWDDGVHDNIRMITITYHGPCVDSVKFEYANGTETAFGDDHGYIHRDHKKEFKLYLYNEYITSVEGHYGKKLPPPGTTERRLIEAFDYEYITMLKFKTNMTTYHVLEHNPDHTYVGTPISLEEKDHKIVGFHGKCAHSLKQIGVYVKPINNS